MNTPAQRLPWKTLNRRVVIDQAMRVVETEGIDKLSMRRVAEQLGASPMSLYRHVASKKELLGALAEEVMADLRPPGGDRTPRARVLAALEHAREAMSRHPWLLPVLLAQDPPPVRRPWLTEHVLDALLEAGLDESAAVCAYRSLWQYVTGHLLNAGREDAWRERAASAHTSDELATELEPFPVLRHALPRLASLDVHEQFTAGLEAQLDGFLATAERA
ncbi:TetR/AcrR family transcriptional regulator [Streptomyces cacaoi]